MIVRDFEGQPSLAQGASVAGTIFDPPGSRAQGTEAGAPDGETPEKSRSERRHSRRMVEYPSRIPTHWESICAH